jgi:hypothetical protein
LECNSNRNQFTERGWQWNGFGKGLITKQTASSIYKLSGKNTEEPNSLKWKMELHENATTHLANQEIVIPMSIALDHPKTQPDTFTCRTSSRTKQPPVTR